jgi:hypothetical protein
MKKYVALQTIEAKVPWKSSNNNLPKDHRFDQIQANGERAVIWARVMVSWLCNGEHWAQLMIRLYYNLCARLYHCQQLEYVAAVYPSNNRIVYTGAYELAGKFGSRKKIYIVWLYSRRSYLEHDLCSFWAQLVSLERDQETAYSEQTVLTSSCEVVIADLAHKTCKIMCAKLITYYHGGDMYNRSAMIRAKKVISSTWP